MDDSKNPSFLTLLLAATTCGILVALLVKTITSAMDYEMNPAIVGGITGGVIAGAVFPMMRRRGNPKR